MPILGRRKKRSKPKKESSSRSNRSVSPKVESMRKGKSSINNISSISRNVPTASDVSFEIDLNHLGILPVNKVHKSRLQEQKNNQKVSHFLRRRSEK